MTGQFILYGQGGNRTFPWNQLGFSQGEKYFTGSSSRVKYSEQRAGVLTPKKMLSVAGSK